MINAITCRSICHLFAVKLWFALNDLCRRLSASIRKMPAQIEKTTAILVVVKARLLVSGLMSRFAVYVISLNLK